MNRSIISRFLLAALLLLCSLGYFSACLSEITLGVPEGNSENLAIRGTLMATEVPYILVKITKVSNFKKFEIPEPVIGAVVVLMDELGHHLEIPMQEDGEYELMIPETAYDLEVKPGHSYQLSVTTATGKTYLSTMETLYPVPTPTSLEPIVENRDVINSAGNIIAEEFIRFLITSSIDNPDNSGRAYLKWSFLGTYRFTESLLDVPLPPQVNTCYFFDDLNLDKVVVFNGEESKEDLLSDFLLLEEPLDYRFYEGFYLSVFQQSLSEGAYHYWDEIRKVVDQSGTFFEAQPGKVKGNFHNVDDEKEEVFGYFYATQEAVIRYYIGPGTFQVNRFCPPKVQPGEAFDGVCLNCLSRPRSTLDKPDFWDQ